MKPPVPAELIHRYGIISDQVEQRELGIILDELTTYLTHHTEGNIVEFGCYAGTTSLYIRRLLDLFTSSRHEFHVYDSFAGLPDKTSPDHSPAGEQFKAGELSVSKKDFIMNFKKAGLKLPFVHKAWFDELTSADIPERIGFAFLDGDYYESIKTSLHLIEKKLTDDAVIIVDDYSNVALPGAARAVDEWLVNHPARLRIAASLAIIKF